MTGVGQASGLSELCFVGQASGLSEVCFNDQTSILSDRESSDGR
jgi:hypothetical protein